jgi:ribosome-associated translation inhibitor RaiA
MEIQFYIRSLSINPAFRRRYELGLERLEGLIAIGAAAVVLEHQRDEALPFRAYVSLAVPGPDIHADARAHTLEAAWLRVTESPRKQMERRLGRRKAREKSRRQMPLSTSRWGGGAVGARA